MALFKIEEDRLERLPPRDFSKEAELHKLFDRNLEVLFGVRFLEAEYPIPSGKIETLGLDEHNVPVVIEYKMGQDPGAITQGLFYLKWVMENKRAFAAIARERLDAPAQVNWAAPPRLIVVAKDFNVRDLASVSLIAASVELKRYSLYGERGDLLQVDDVTPSRGRPPAKEAPQAEPPEYPIEGLLKKVDPPVAELFFTLRDQILSLPQVWEKVGSYYCDYRTTSTFASFNFRKKNLIVYIKMGERIPDDPRKITERKDFGFGRLNTRFYLQPGDDINYAMRLIKQAYEYVGV